MNFFYSESSKIQDVVTWDKLLKDLHEEKTYNKFCFTSDFHEIFKRLIISLILDEEIILLDYDFSEDELKKFVGNVDINQMGNNISIPEFVSNKDLIDYINDKINNWRITLFTSGTTGLPKKIKHNYRSITRFVRTSPKHVENVWGFAYNPTHMAGVQVFFQAFLNSNTIIRLFGESKLKIEKIIDQFQITHISATPSFFRLLLPSAKSFFSVKRITSGGEKFDTNTVDKIKQLFPNAKFNNIYASTELGSLLVSNGDVFKVSQSYKDLVKVEDDELLVKKELLGEANEEIAEDWFKTGDMVELICNNPLSFKFISRKSEIINIGGYNVNPHEVESAIRNLKGVREVLVYSKKNSVIGNIIYCDIVRGDSSLTEKDIRNSLTSRLQEFKIPRIIRFVDNLEVTRTGKLKR